MQNERLLAYCHTRSIERFSIAAVHEATIPGIRPSCSKSATKHLVIAMKIMEQSYRFRDINAVGTQCAAPGHRPDGCRIVSGISTLLAHPAVGDDHVALALERLEAVRDLAGR